MVFKRQWRDYRTASGARPVKDFLDELSDDELADVVAGMKDVAERGLIAAKHLREEIYEVRADSRSRSFRLLFAKEGNTGRSCFRSPSLRSGRRRRLLGKGCGADANLRFRRQQV